MANQRVIPLPSNTPLLIRLELALNGEVTYAREKVYKTLTPHGYIQSGHIDQISPRQTQKEIIQLPTKSKNCRHMDYRHQKT